MSGNGNAAVGLLGFWMMLQLVFALLLLLGGVYLLYCASKAASGLDRLANAAEDWVALQRQAQAARPNLPPGRVAPAPQPFTPGVAPPAAAAPSATAPSTAPDPSTPGTAPITGALAEVPSTYASGG